MTSYIKRAMGVILSLPMTSYIKRAMGVILSLSKGDVRNGQCPRAKHGVQARRSCFTSRTSVQACTSA
ncbi:MAG TPA: hypothetical protein VIM55_08795 [Mucilaginibacter sp.]